MAIDFNDPDVIAAIEKAASEKAATLVEAEVESQIKGLKDKNYEVIGKNKELQERVKQFDGVDPDELANLRRLTAAKEHDEIVELVVGGKLEEAKARMTKDAVDPWKQKTDDLVEQLTVSQSSIDEYKTKLSQSEATVTEMQKKQFLRELTSKDDSFKSEHFDDFYALNRDRMSIDENGNVYAMKDGNQVLDTEGKRVSYEDAYNKQKVNSGLFWQGGQGSSAKGMAGKEGFGGDPTKWSAEQRHEYITNNSIADYAKLVAGKK